MICTPTLTLIREPLRDAHELGATRGILLLEGPCTLDPPRKSRAIRTPKQNTWWTLERPWLDNAKGLSCIPDGKYPIVRRMRGGFFARYHNRWKHDFAIEIGDVPGRTHILMHTGNCIQDSAGCILVGTEYGTRMGDPYISKSRLAYQEVYKVLKEVFKGTDQPVIEVTTRVDDNRNYGDNPRTHHERT